MRFSPLKLGLICILCLSQVLLVVFFLAYKNFNLLLGSWSEKTNLSIYLKADTTLEEKEKLLEFLKKDNANSSANVISRQQAAKEFQKSLGAYADGLLNIDELIDLVPETIELSLGIGSSNEDKINYFQTLSQKLGGFGFVEESVYGLDWLKKFSKFDQFLKITGLSSFAILLLAMGFLSALMVRILIEDSKAEIEVFSMLGATRWSIYKIFLKDLSFTVGSSLIGTFLISYVIFAASKAAFLKNDMAQMIATKFTFLNAAELSIFSITIMLFLFLVSFASMTSALKKLSLLTYD